MANTAFVIGQGCETLNWMEDMLHNWLSYIAAVVYLLLSCAVYQEKFMLLVHRTQAIFLWQSLYGKWKTLMFMTIIITIYYHLSLLCGYKYIHLAAVHTTVTTTLLNSMMSLFRTVCRLKLVELLISLLYQELPCIGLAYVNQFPLIYLIFVMMQLQTRV